MTRKIGFILCCILACFMLFSCFDEGNAVPDGISNMAIPSPSPSAEEDLLLRRPDSVADPEDYTIETEPPETKAPETEKPETTPPAPETQRPADDTPPKTEPEQPTTEPPKQDPQPPVSGETRISFVAVGDNVIHGAIMEDAQRHASGGAEYDFRYMYDHVRDRISKADVAFINQETPMGGKELGYTGYPNFNGPQEMGDAVVDAGFDIVCIATNHMADYRDAGLAGTIKYWKSKPVTLVGGFESAADYEVVRVHETNGIKIALLAYTYGTNGMSVTANSGLVVPYINEADIKRQVAKAKEAGDIVVVNMHWGTDSSFTVTQEQKNQAQLLADLGVDVIIGEHPHVLQPMGWITGKNGNKTLYTYSIGNFLSTMYWDYCMVGGMLSFDIVKNSTGTHVENAMLYPTVTYYDNNRSNLSIYFMEDFTEELCASHGCNLNAKTSLAQMKKYVTNVIPAEFLPAYMK